jgi:tetratricopeptide (TPR) repeat protein
VDNPEILNWEGMIRVGLRSGRTIPGTAPLYAEMSQLLSEARKNYEEGRDLIAASRTEGLRKLDMADQNIQKVQLVYPMNEEAGLLNLRIEQVRDPAAFTAAFETRVNNAIAGTRRRDMQAYNDLLNLRTINPQYPNWTSIITQAEIAVGIRPPPPRPEDLALSAELTARARAVVRARDSSRMEDARTDLSQAIKLNPGNQEAIDLFREASQVTAVTTLVLDAEAERKYQQAIAALNQNNAIGALTLVNEIYAQNPRYRNNSRMITLEQRVRASL